MEGLFAAHGRCPQALPASCGVHPTRPAACRAFQCMWLLSEHMPEELRPDRCGFFVRLLGDADVDLSLEVVETPPGVVRARLLFVLELVHWVCETRDQKSMNVQFRSRQPALCGKAGQLKLAFERVRDMPRAEFAESVVAGWETQGVLERR